MRCPQCQHDNREGATFCAEKILTSRNTLQGERKQATMRFVHIKDSTELIKDLDPEAVLAEVGKR